MTTCSSFSEPTNMNTIIYLQLANKITISPAALSTDIGLCRLDESNEKFGILMVKNKGIWGSVGVSYFPILSNSTWYNIHSCWY